MEIAIPKVYKNRKVSEVWVENKRLLWNVDKQSKINLTKSYISTLASLKPTKEEVVSFIKNNGPIWHDDRPGGYSKEISLTATLSLLRWYNLLYLLTRGINEAGQPRYAEELDDKFFIPLMNWEETWEKVTSGLKHILPAGYSGEMAKGILIGRKRALEKGITVDSFKARGKKFKLWLVVQKDDGRCFFTPVEYNSEYWPTFEIPPGLKTWEQKKEWLLRQLVRGAAELLQRNMTIGIKSLNDTIVPKLSIKNAFTWAVASLMFDKPNKCLICGKIIANGRYCSRKCEKAALSTAPKQRFLEYIYTQKRRGKLTSEEYEYAKDRTSYYFNKLSEDEDFYEDSSLLVKKVVTALKKKWPKGDYSFILQGYGSKQKGKAH